MSLKMWVAGLMFLGGSFNAIGTVSAEDIDVSKTVIYGEGQGPAFFTINSNFTIPVGATNISLNIFQVDFDDRGVVLLNGQIVASAGIGAPKLGSMRLTETGPNDPFFFQYSGSQQNILPILTGFNFGLNTLELVINNTGSGISGDIRAGGPSAVRFDAKVSYTSGSAVPGPLAGAGLVPLLGLAGAWFARRRHRTLAA